MDSKKIDIKILKSIIFEIAKNNLSTLSDIAQKKKLKYETVEEQGSFLQEMGLLEYLNIESAALPGKIDKKGFSSIPVRFKQNIETLQKIANLFDDKELSRFMKTKYYRDNIEYYCKFILISLNEHKLTPLPDAEYLEYAITNSPSNVRFFLVDNDIKAMTSFHQRCISTAREKIRDRIKIELLEKYNMYIIWDNVIFGKIQEDLLKEILLNPINYFAGYLPLAKKTFEKLLEISGTNDKNAAGKPTSKSKLTDYFKSLKSVKQLGIF